MWPIAYLRTGKTALSRVLEKRKRSCFKIINIQVRTNLISEIFSNYKNLHQLL
jgi:hypothetical protein